MPGKANTNAEALEGRARALGLIDQAPVALIVTDRSGTIATWNPAAEQLLGWSQGEVLGRTITSVAAARSATSVDRVLEEAAAGSACGAAVDVCDSAGGQTSVHLRGAPLLDGHGNRVGVVFAALKAHPDERLRQAYDEARARRAIGRRIARARKEVGLTQQELAERLRVTRRSVQGYEAGAVVPYRRLSTLAEVVGRPARWLLAGDDSQPAAAEALSENILQLLREELPELLKGATRSSAA